MKLGISTETTIDLPQAMLDEFDIKTVPFSIIFGTDVKKDGEITSTDIFNYVKEYNELPKTSAVNQFQYEELFTEVLKTHDEVIHLCFSGELSSAYRNAVLAAQNFNGKVHVINTLMLSTGIASLAIYIRELEKEGKSVDEIVRLVTARIPNLCLSFVIETVDYLHKGGRCSAMAALGANLFHIRPEIIMKDGKLMGGKKFRGPYAKVVQDYIDDVLANNPNANLDYIFITHSVQDPAIVQTTKEKLIAHGFKKIYITNAGCTISSHCGPNTLGVIFVNN